MVLIIIVSCEKESNQTTKPIVTETPCIKDSTINFTGKFAFIRYTRNFASNYQKVYIDTPEVIITHTGCKTLELSIFEDYKFVYDSINTFYGKYVGKYPCACSNQITLINKNTINVYQTCGGGGSPCPLGMVTYYYEGKRIE